MFYHLRQIFLLLIMVVGLAINPVLVASNAAVAQNKATKENPAFDANALQNLVEAIENDAERKKFLERLKALVATQKAADQKKKADSDLLNKLATHARSLTDSFKGFASIASGIPNIWNWLRTHLAKDTQRARLIAGFWQSALALLIGLMVESLLRILLRRPRQRIEDRDREPFTIRAAYLAVRTLMDMLPIAAFGAAAYATLSQLEPSATTIRVALTLIYGFILARVILAIARTLLAPRIDSLRILPISDSKAAYLYVWVRRIANTIVYGYFGLQALAVFNPPASIYEALLRLLGIVVTMMLIVLILQNRRAVADTLRGSAEDSSLRRAIGRLGDLWHVVAIVYVLAGFFVWLLDVDGGFTFMLRATALSLLVGVTALALMVGIRRLLIRLFRIDDDLKQKNPELENQANRYLYMVHRILFLAILTMTALVILDIWGLGILEILRTNAGRAVVRAVIVLVLVVISVFVLWDIINTATARYLSRLEESGGQRAMRMRTLLPMIKKGLLVAIVVTAILIVLSEMGLNIGPLLAGAGVLGLAIGFGAQTLVKDVITGIFNIVEDTMAVGDVVTVAGRRGVVEDLSIRSITLRDYFGTQHTIPFSSIDDVQNLTKDYSYSVFDYGVGYRENVDEVIGIICEVGATMKADPEFGEHILDDLEVAGLQELGDSAVVIRSRFKCTPGWQWNIRREMNKRIKTAFDARNIEIPFPHTTMYFGEDKAGDAPSLPVRMIDAARQDSADRVDSFQDNEDVKSEEPMATINVRQLADDVVDRLKQRASSNNRSLEGEVRHILQCAADDDMAAKRARFLVASRRLREKTEGRKQTPAEVLIREDRDRGHRDDF